MPTDLAPQTSCPSSQSPRQGTRLAIGDRVRREVASILAGGLRRRLSPSSVSPEPTAEKPPENSLNYLERGPETRLSVTPG